MASTGNVFPGTGASANRGASGDHVAWTNPGNVVSDNTTDTTCALGSIGAHYLVCSNFDFSALPANVEIRGITVRVEASETGTGSSNYIPQLISATTPTLIGAAKTAVTVSGTTPTVSTNGSATDLWSAGGTLTAALIKTSAFGVAIWSDDTTNTLSIDYVTVAVEWTDIPGAWNGTNYFRKRKATRHKLRTLSFDNFPAPAVPPVTAPGWLPPLGFFKRKNLTHRRRVRLPQAEQSPPPRSNDREFEPPFVTRRQRSRRALRVPELPSTTPAAPAASPDRTLVRAFITALLRSRKVLVPPPLGQFPVPAAPAAPPKAAWRLRTALRRKPTRHRALRAADVPSVVLVAAQTGLQLLLKAFKRRVTRHVVRALTPAPYTPRTPNNEPLDAWKLARSKRSLFKTTRRVVVHNSFPTTSAQTQPEPSWRLPQKFYARFTVKRRRLVPAPYTPRTPNNEPEAAWRAPRKFFAKFARKLQRLPEIDYFPTTAPTPPQPETAWRLVRARFSKSVRKLITAPPPARFPQTPFINSDVARGFVTRMLRSRRLLTLRWPGVAPQPTPPSVAPDAAVRPPKKHRRRARTALQLQPPPINEARVQPPWPSYAAPIAALRRRDTKRKRRALQRLDSFPASPTPPQPLPAWAQKRPLRATFRRALKRVLRALKPAPYTPRTPNNEPFSAWKQPKTNVVKFVRRVQKPREIDHYQLTAPVPPQPFDAYRAKKALRAAFRITRQRVTHSVFPPTPPPPPMAAWTKPKANRIEYRRELQPAAPQLRFPATVLRGAITHPDALRRRATARRLLTLPHAPQYRATPVITAPQNAWRLKLALRRHGWKRRRDVTLLLERPLALERGYLLGTPSIYAALQGAPAVQAALGGVTVTTAPALQGAPGVKPPP